MKKILITGGSGFIGTNLVNYLIQKIKYKLYSEPIQPHNYSIYLDEREISIICL